MDEVKVDPSASSAGVSPQQTESEVVIAGLVAMEKTDQPYVEKIFLQRAGLKPDGSTNTDAAGSIYPDLTPAQLRECLTKAEWASYDHPAVMQGCKAFIAPIPGRLGIVDLSSLAEDPMVTLDDRKGTGKASATVRGLIGPEVSFTVAILGPNETTGILELWTFHPGAPVVPSIVDVQGRHGQEISIKEANSLGFEKAKIVV